MVDEEEEGKKEEKFDFDLAGEALGYISLEQARVLAIQHARDNTEFYGRKYAKVRLVWEVISQEEGEDYYDIRLSYRPAGRFRGEPGVEQLTIDKTGKIELRQILDEPQGTRAVPTPLLVAVGVVLIGGAVGGGLFASGIFAGGDDGGSPTPVPVAAAAAPATPTPVPTAVAPTPAPEAAAPATAGEEDFVRVPGIDPPDGTVLDAGALVTVKAEIEFALASQDKGSVTLQVGPPGGPFPIFAEAEVEAGSGAVTLVGSFDVPDREGTEIVVFLTGGDGKQIAGLSAAFYKIRQQPTPVVVVPIATPVPAPTAPPANERNGGVLRVALEADPQGASGFDFYRSPRVSLLQAISPAYNGLFEQNPEDPNEYLPVLAEKWESFGGGVRWNIAVRTDARFHSGRAVTAPDVVATLDYIRANGSDLVRDDLARMIDGYQVIDDFTVEIRLRAPFAAFLPVLGQGFMNIYPQELLLPTALESPESVSGTGPFRLTEYKQGELLQYERNFDYFVSGRPLLDGLRMFVIPDAATRLAALSAEAIDLSLPSLTMGEISRLRGTEAKLLGGPMLNQWTVDFNTLERPWDDPRVRRAAIMALDRDLIRQKIQGLGGSPGLYMPPWGQWATPTDPNLSYAPDKARQLLAQAGYSDGFKTELMYAPVGDRDSIADLVNSMWSDIGIATSIRQVGFAEFRRLRSEGAFMTTIEGFAWSLDDPDIILRQGYTSDGSRNYPRFSSPEFDSLIEAQSRELDSTRRRELTLRLQALLRQEAPRAVLYWDILRRGMQGNVQGYVPPQSVYARTNFADVWLDQ